MDNTIGSYNTFLSILNYHLMEETMIFTNDDKTLTLTPPVNDLVNTFNNLYSKHSKISKKQWDYVVAHITKLEYVFELDIRKSNTWNTLKVENLLDDVNDTVLLQLKAKSVDTMQATISYTDDSLLVRKDNFNEDLYTYMNIATIQLILAANKRLKSHGIRY